MRIRPAVLSDREEWARMRSILWSYGSFEEHLAEIDAMFLQAPADVATLVAEREDGSGLAGFIELSLRSTAEGCDEHPVGYIEGWYVDEDARQRGIGRALVKAGEEWALGLGCNHMGSDTELHNRTSQAAHERLGYTEVDRLVHFLKKIG